MRESRPALFVFFGIVFAAAALVLASSHSTKAWGLSANKLIVNQAVDTLPADLRAYFDANRAFILSHVNDPNDALAKDPTSRRNHYIYLDKYGRFPYELLPRDYKAALAKYGRSKLDANGLLPWEIGVYSAKLTDAMKTGKSDEVKLNAAILANYVADAHNPFNTTEDFDGRLTGQAGIQDRFGTVLVDRYASFFPLRPNDAIYIHDPTDHAFEACLSAHSWLETILLADRNSRRGLNSYTDEYYDRFYNQAAAILIRQLSDASTDIGSFWLTAWKNAGQPQLPH